MSPLGAEPDRDADRVSLVWVTAPDVEQAERLARVLVEERLVACVNVVPGVQSIYRWEGSVQEDSEVLMIMKTRATAVAALSARVEALHPYDVPEVIALDVTGGSAPYLEWVQGAVS